MSPLPTAALGANGPQVPRLGLGLMGLSVGYGKPKPDEERLAFLDAAYQLGETFWDTGMLLLQPKLRLGQANCESSRCLRRQ